MFVLTNVQTYLHYLATSSSLLFYHTLTWKRIVGPFLLIIVWKKSASLCGIHWRIWNSYKAVKSPPSARLGASGPVKDSCFGIMVDDNILIRYECHIKIIWLELGLFFNLLKWKETLSNMLIWLLRFLWIRRRTHNYGKQTPYIYVTDWYACKVRKCVCMSKSKNEM